MNVMLIGVFLLPNNEIATTIARVTNSARIDSSCFTIEVDGIRTKRFNELER